MPRIVARRSSTPRMSITSATPAISGQRSISRISSGPNTAPPRSSPGAEGTQDGASARMRSGRPDAASIAQRRPARPETLPISCGSQQIVVVPCGTTVSA